MGDKNKHMTLLEAVTSCMKRAKESGNNEYGCVVRHGQGIIVSSPGTAEKDRKTVDSYSEKGSYCDHINNGFEHSKTEKALFNRNDHKIRAQNLGYISNGSIPPKKHSAIKEALNAYRDKTTTTDAEEKKLIDKIVRKTNNSLRLLIDRNDAFHIGEGIKNKEKLLARFFSRARKYKMEEDENGKRHRVYEMQDGEYVYKGWDEIKAASPNLENFVPFRNGGLGSKTPYHHNHHHLLTNGIMRSEIIFGEPLKVGPERRIAIIIGSKWNLNRKENMILLPQEEMIGKIVALPAHCPYGFRDHPGYNRFVKTLAEDVKKLLNKKPDDCEEHEANVKSQLEDISEKCLNKIKELAQEIANTAYSQLKDKPTGLSLPV